METQTEAGPETLESEETAAAPATRRRARTLVFGITLLCAGLATAGVLFATRSGDGHNGADARHRGATIRAAYQITGHGTAQISYAGADGRLHTVSAHLPWHGGAELTASTPAVVSIVLGKEGGNATCSVSLHGKVVQQATAYGTYGRANCRTASR
ncbi:MmpS family transport accessory protein [Streptomyces spiralis]|uniref:MmpS family transport accessory protein n=1 Tax=Streptomyces spiralis TaxID=66376 RepID=UPI0033CF299F